MIGLCHLTIGNSSIRFVQWVLSIGSRLRFEVDKFFVDKRELHGSRFEFAIPHTPPIVHMEVDRDEFGHDGSEDIQNTPLLSVDVIEMELSYYLIDVVKILDREIFESWVLSSLAIYFKENMFFEQFIEFYHID